MASRMLSGKVVGMKQDKTIIVEVARVKTHASRRILTVME
jgi:ribosomal protein S17